LGLGGALHGRLLRGPALGHSLRPPLGEESLTFLLPLGRLQGCLLRRLLCGLACGLARGRAFGDALGHAICPRRLEPCAARVRLCRGFGHRVYDGLCRRGGLPVRCGP